VTPDGAFIIGSSAIVGGPGSGASFTFRAVRWDASGTIQDLGVVPGGTFARGWAASSDGSVVVGWSGNPNLSSDSDTHAFRWTESGGMQDLNQFGLSSTAYAVSDDGSVVACEGYFLNDLAALLWTEGTGLVDLNAYLPTIGIDLGDWNLRMLRGMSADGRTIAGTGWRGESTLDEGWIATLPATLPPCFTLGPMQVTRTCPPGSVTLSISAIGIAPSFYVWQQRSSGGDWQYMDTTQGPSEPVRLSAGPGVTTYTLRVIAVSDCTTKASESALFTICRADYDCDGRVTTSDIFAYLNAWLSGSYLTDLDGSGAGSASNLLAFLSDWFAGC
jgi:probable HAF family extracellular repeat protein